MSSKQNEMLGGSMEQLKTHSQKSFKLTLLKKTYTKLRKKRFS